MSTDVIADALLPTCESSIKSLSQILATLHSIDALYRLKEKVDVVEAFLVIASFAPLLASPPPPVPPTTVNFDGSSLDGGLEQFERPAETPRRNRLAVAGGCHDETIALSHTPASAHPSMLEDGRDDGDDVPPPSQLVFSKLAPPAHLIHPVRESELSSFAPNEPPLYSFLIHFPIYCAVRAKLSNVDRVELFSLPVMQKWGFGRAMADYAYPRLRLTNEGTACIVMCDDLGILEAIREDFQNAERDILAKGAADDAVLDRTFFIVGTWIEEHVTLVFSVSHVVEERETLGRGFERWTTAPGALWKDILNIHPILSHYQEMTRGEEGGSSLLGAGLFYQKQIFTRARQGSNIHHLTLVAPFLGCPHAHLFAHDFVAQHSKISFALDGRKYTVGVKVVKMRPPSLKDDRNWDGPVLRHDQWLDGIDTKFQA